MAGSRVHSAVMVTVMRRTYRLNVAKLQLPHFLNCQILTRQNLTHQKFDASKLTRRNPSKTAVLTRQNLAGIRQ